MNKQSPIDEILDFHAHNHTYKSWSSKDEAKSKLYQLLLDDLIGEDEDRNHRYNRNWKDEVDGRNYLRAEQRTKLKQLMRVE